MNKYTQLGNTALHHSNYIKMIVLHHLNEITTTLWLTFPQKCNVVVQPGQFLGETGLAKLSGGGLILGFASLPPIYTGFTMIEYW